MREQAQEKSCGWKQKILHEQEAWSRGHARVAGIDEVGRGPLAGPVVAACVVLTQAFFLPEPPAYVHRVDDSKKLTAAVREKLAALLRQEPGLEIGVGVVDNQTIDGINILEASRAAMRQAIAQIQVPPDFLLVDGPRLPAVEIPQNALIGGDGLSFCIGAASIVAKVYRDALMDRFDAEYPGYGFARNKGYGTREHLQALKANGPCPIHRKSFFPVKSAAEPVPA